MKKIGFSSEQLQFADTKIYGGHERNGTVPCHFCPSSASIARRVLQALENIRLNQFIEFFSPKYVN